jgi:hypothetical protein
MSYVLTPLASETFTEANRNPLNPANWTQFTDVVNYTPLQVVSNRCEATSTSITSAENYTGIAWPDNQYASIKIQRNTGEEVDIFLQSDASGEIGYDFSHVDNGGGTATVSIADNEGNTVFENVALPWANNDVFTFACFGLNLLAYQNGTLIGQGLESTAVLTGGVPALSVATDTLSNVRLVNFVGGSVTNPVAPVLPVSIIGATNNALSSSPSSDYMHLLDSLGKVIGWIDFNGHLAGTLGLLPGSKPLPNALLVSNRGDGVSDYFWFVTSNGQVLARITAQGKLISGGSTPIRGFITRIIPAPPSAIISNGAYPTDLLDLLNSKKQLIGFIDPQGFTGGSL